MNTKLNSHEFFVAAIIVGTVLFFFMYYYTAHSGFLNKIQKGTEDKIQQKMLFFLSQKLTGFIFMGLIPGLLYHFLRRSQMQDFGLSLNHFTSNLTTILGLMAVIVAILFINYKLKPDFDTLQIHMKNWSLSLFAVNAFGWIIYLIAYEFLFRGILLFECYNVLGFWPAIAINIAIYAAIHMVNGKDQAIGALIFGTIACYLALTRGTILIPVFMHITLSLTADLLSIRSQKRKLKLQEEKIKIQQK